MNLLLLLHSRKLVCCFAHLDEDQEPLSAQWQLSEQNVMCRSQPLMWLYVDVRPLKEPL